MCNTVGTCSLCGGRVVVNTYCGNTRPSCERCGAVAKENYGPVIKMQPKPQPWPWADQWGWKPPSWLCQPENKTRDFFRERAGR